MTAKKSHRAYTFDGKSNSWLAEKAFLLFRKWQKLNKAFGKSTHRAEHRAMKLLCVAMNDDENTFFTAVACQKKRNAI